MKEVFPQFYRPTNEEFSRLWNSCIFVLDASVLLNIYGYSENTREDLLALIEVVSNRIRTPYQFAQEYQRNRVKAIMEQVRNYQRAEKTLDELYRLEFAIKSKHPFLSEEALRSFTNIQNELEANRKKHECFLTDDPYFDRVSKALTIIGSPPKDLNVLHAQGKTRYDSKIPPGYADKEKGEPSAYGDFIGWCQIIDFAKVEKAPVILVSDDGKEDWWEMHSERYIGPRPELIAECLALSGQQFYMYNSWRFMEMSKHFLQQNVGDKAIEEIKERLEQSRSIIDAKPSHQDNTVLAIGVKAENTLNALPSDLKQTGPVREEISGGLKADGKK